MKNALIICAIILLIGIFWKVSSKGYDVVYNEKNHEFYAVNKDGDTSGVLRAISGAGYFDGVGLAMIMGSDNKVRIDTSLVIYRPSITTTRVMRDLNTAYQALDTTRPAIVIMPISISSTIMNASPGQSAVVILEDSVRNVAGWNEISRVSSGLVGNALGSTVLTNNPQINVIGLIKASRFYRLSVTGTSTVTALTGTEIKL